MDYKILSEQISSQAALKQLAERAEAEGYHLYAGISENDRYGHDEKGANKLTTSNSYLHNGEMYAKTKHFDIATDSTESTLAPQTTADEAPTDRADLVAKLATLAAENERLTKAVEELEEKTTELSKYAAVVAVIDKLVKEAVTEKQEAYEHLLSVLNTMKANLEQIGIA